jgi:hypothetical protein
MRHCGMLLLLAGVGIFSLAQNDPGGPTNEKAQKTYQQAIQDLEHRMTAAALTTLRKPTSRTTGSACLARKR